MPIQLQQFKIVLESKKIEDQKEKSFIKNVDFDVFFIDEVQDNNNKLEDLSNIKDQLEILLQNC
ncbi:22561_t:CDS:2 [Gigaspora margarita]|uniref:22561_t:CDS:1 n=1 Tax=Gigaspora margarita TaxID=4874 RepID=A0ABN7UJT7_GIGMA|nr:22561_t:CDS:2 [Gigaspora margarita]